MQAVRLTNSSAVRRLLNRSVNLLLNDEIQTDKARTIGYLCSILLKAMEVEDLEARMAELERQLEAS